MRACMINRTVMALLHILLIRDEDKTLKQYHRQMNSLPELPVVHTRAARLEGCTLP